MVQYFLVGTVAYLFALILGTIIRVLLNVEFVSVDGVQVDLVTYIAVGSIDFLINVVSTLGAAGIIMFFWLWNLFIVDIFFKGILDTVFTDLLNSHIFSGISRVSDASVATFVDALISIFDIFKTNSFLLLNGISQAANDVVEDIVGYGAGSRGR